MSTFPKKVCVTNFSCIYLLIEHHEWMKNVYFGQIHLRKTVNITHDSIISKAISTFMGNKKEVKYKTNQRRRRFF